MLDVLALINLVCFATIARGAFALMTQSLRRSESPTSAPSMRKRSERHPEAPQLGDELLYVDFSRERLEQMYQDSH